MKTVVMVVTLAIGGCGAEPGASTGEPLSVNDTDGGDAASTVTIVVRCAELDGAPAPCFGDGG